MAVGLGGICRKVGTVGGGSLIAEREHGSWMGLAGECCGRWVDWRRRFDRREDKEKSDRAGWRELWEMGGLAAAV